MSPDQLCPRCGALRTGPFRYCRTCGLDFDLLLSAQAVSSPSSMPGALIDTFEPEARATAGSSWWRSGVSRVAASLGLGASAERETAEVNGGWD
jgi:hypothetical protein